MVLTQSLKKQKVQHNLKLYLRIEIDVFQKFKN